MKSPNISSIDSIMQTFTIISSFCLIEFHTPLIILILRLFIQSNKKNNKLLYLLLSKNKFSPFFVSLSVIYITTSNNTNTLQIQIIFL